MGRRGLRLVALAAVTVLALGACGGGNATPQAGASQSAKAPKAAGSPGRTAGSVIRWYVGLGSGTTTGQVNAEKAFVASYNQLNPDGITLKLEVQPSATAYDTLKSEMAAGNSPDIVGPIGMAAQNGFEGLFTDLSSEITKYNYDLKAFPDELVKFLNQGKDGQIGLPYLCYPGYIWYNKDAFTKANLPGLPTKVGDTYQGQPWDWNALGKVAAQLTLDNKGRKATDTGFDKANIVKYGMDFQGLDARRIASLFGSGSFLNADGKTAQVPATWADAFTWYNSAMWTGHYAPSAAAESGVLLAGGNSMASGNVAMNAAWGQSITSIAASASTAKVKNWDIGVIPSWKGTTTSPLDAETFTITKTSSNPDAAFKAMLAIMADTSLMKAYGGLPAKVADQSAYTSALDSTLAPIFPGIKVSWSVLDEMMVHPAMPSDLENLPGLAQVTTDYTAFLTKLQANAGLDMKAELAKLLTTLQADFNAAQPIVLP